jgi:bifunctional non-homologous end joining protein LigD
LEKAIDGAERIFSARRLPSVGVVAYREAQQRGFEGFVGKDASSPYTSGRTRRWLEVKIKHQEEFVVVGYTKPAGSRSHFGAILIGGYRDEKLLYAGHVGTGFSEAQLAQL